MDRRKQRSQKRTAVTKEQPLDFLRANDAAEQNCEANQCGEMNNNGTTQPSGAATPRNSDAHERIAVPQALCVLREHLRPRLKSGKVCRSDTRPGDVRERAACVEGNDSAPVRNAPCFAVCAVVCDPVGEGECVPAFTRESKRGPFVREVETAMRNGWGTALVAATLPDLI